MFGFGFVKLGEGVAPGYQTDRGSWPVEVQPGLLPFTSASYLDLSLGHHCYLFRIDRGPQAVLAGCGRLETFCVLCVLGRESEFGLSSVCGSRRSWSGSQQHGLWSWRVGVPSSCSHQLCPSGLGFEPWLWRGCFRASC